ncbi:MAG: alpha/beta hydrolase [Coprobacillus sp.]
MKKFNITNQGTVLYGMIKGQMNSKHIFITLHGGPGGNMKDMADVSICKSLEKDHICVYFDQRGCGESVYDLKQGLTPSLLIEDVKAVIEYIKLHYSQCYIHLLGFSFGGYLGFLTLHSYPDIVQDYIVCNPAITFSRDEALAMFDRVQGGYDKRFPQLSKTQEEPEIVMKSQVFTDFVFSNNNTANSLRYMHAMSAWFFKIDFTDILKDIKISTLIFQGKKDKICHQENLQKALLYINNNFIQYHPLDACSHDIDEINGEIITNHIHKFIQGGIL